MLAIYSSHCPANCYFTPEVNAFDGPMDFSVDDGYYIFGIASHHDNDKEYVLVYRLANDYNTAHWTKTFKSMITFLLYCLFLYFYERRHFFLVPRNGFILLV